MLLVCRNCDSAIRGSFLHRPKFSVDGYKGGGSPRRVVGKIQKHTRFFLRVEGGRCGRAHLPHLTPRLVEGRHWAHNLDPEPRGVGVEPGHLVWDLEAGLSVALAPTRWRLLAGHFEACRYDCLDIIARLLIGGKRPREWVAANRGGMMANRSGLPGKGRREESRQCYAARQSETCCNDGIWGLEQPASGCMMEEALVETWLIDLIQCGN